MAPCQAINKKTYYPCGNLARQGHDTCACHKNFYQKRVWLQFSKVLLGYGENLGMGRLEKHVRGVIASGRFTFTEEDIASIPATNENTDLFLILCEDPSVDPNWNKRLALQAVSFYFEMQSFIEGSGSYRIYQQRLYPLLKNPHMGFARTLRFMLFVKFKRDTTRALMHLEPRPAAPSFDPLFLDYKGEYALYSEEHLCAELVHPSASKNLDAYFKNDIMPRLKQRKAEIKSAKKASMDPLKEELVAKVFHPKNVARWLDVGGFELLEMMFGE